MDPVTAVFNFATQIMEAINKDTEMMAAASPETKAAYAESKMKLLTRLNEIMLHVLAYHQKDK